MIISTTDSNIFVVHITLPVIKKFDSDGRLMFKKEIKLKELSEIKKNYFLTNDSLMLRNVFYKLRYWLDAVPDESGGVYLLLNGRNSMIIFHLSGQGEIIEKLNWPVKNISHIDLLGNELWAYSTETQYFYKFIL